MTRSAEAERNTRETQITARIDINGTGICEIDTGIAFFDHMLTLFAVHGFFDLQIRAKGDIDVDYHHTVEDSGLVLGDLINRAIGKKRGIVRYGHAVTPMDDAISEVAVDLSGRPYLVYDLPATLQPASGFNAQLAREFFRAVANAAGMNLHIQVRYGENDHHATEAVFKSFARALDQATSIDTRISGIQSTKGTL
ncbi:MAG: imidazoleglycerol-phosphate dehydratase HisB [Desulfobacteraceae bacterium]|nr:imidazoleglycerol-phosphate dehydratase HisB [Desulfobacteraceae bacterium]